MSHRHAFADLAAAAYCPRQLYYHRLTDADREPPPAVRERRALAFRYPDLLDPGTDLRADPVDVTPTAYRTNLGCAKARLDGATWRALCDPAERDRLVTGRECRGVVQKVLDLETPVPSLVSAGEPPEEGVWRPQSVRAVAAAKALSWEHGTRVERAFVEYPAHGVVREVALTTRRKARYRAAIRSLEALDGPPPRLDDPAKCDPCEYRTRCGVRTRSLRSLLGL